MKRSVLTRIPPRFRDAHLKHLDPDIYGPVLTYFRKYKSHVKQGVGVLLSGPVGSGKTYAISALTLAVAHLEQDFKCEFVTGSEFFDRVRPVNPDGRDEWRDQSWKKTYTEVPWLVINDLGKEYRGGGFAEQAAFSLGSVLRTRSERMLVTHFTTNLGISAGSGSSSTIPEIYGNSITSMLRETVIPITVRAPDRRSARGL